MAGYNPASNTSANLPQSRAIHYDKKFVENLKTETPFPRCASPRELPLNSGNQLALFEYGTFGANTVQASEGTVGSGITATVLTNSCTIGEYADYASFSSYSVMTAIDPAIENVNKEMAYRLGQTLSILVRNQADFMHNIDSSVLVELPASSTSSYTVNSIGELRAAVQSLAGRSVKPFDEGRARYCGVIHPFTWGDCLNDTTNNSAIDELKHTVQGQMKIEELPSVDLTEEFELPGTGIVFMQSNLVTQTPNYQSVSGLTALRTYIFGKDFVIRVNLGGRGDTPYGDGNYRNCRCFVRANLDPTIADPSGLIAGFSSYRVHFTTTVAPDTTGRGRLIDAASGIS
jgi:hypothetical protein